MPLQHARFPSPSSECFIPPPPIVVETHSHESLEPAPPAPSKTKPVPRPVQIYKHVPKGERQLHAEVAVHAHVVESAIFSISAPTQACQRVKLYVSSRLRGPAPQTLYALVPFDPLREDPPTPGNLLLAYLYQEDGIWYVVHFATE
jgi:hypothetical protein